MEKRKIFCSMLEIEKEYYPDAFERRKKKDKKRAIEEEGINLAQIAIDEVKDELKQLGNVF